MIIRNESRIPTDQLRPWLVAGARGFRDAGVLVVVINDNDNAEFWDGFARHRMATKAYVSRHGIKGNIEYMIEIKVPFVGAVPEVWHDQGLVGIRRRFPDGVPIDGVDDYVVALSAHEFRHIAQFRDNLVRTRNQKPVRRRGELDAELWAIGRLSLYRAQTGRDPLVARKGKPPFGPPGRAGRIVCDGHDGQAMYMVSLGTWSRDPKRARVFRATLSDHSAMLKVCRSVAWNSTGLRYEVLDWGRCPWELNRV